MNNPTPIPGCPPFLRRRIHSRPLPSFPPLYRHSCGGRNPSLRNDHPTTSPPPPPVPLEGRPSPPFITVIPAEAEAATHSPTTPQNVTPPPSFRHPAESNPVMPEIAKQSHSHHPRPTRNLFRNPSSRHSIKTPTNSIKVQSNPPLFLDTPAPQKYTFPSIYQGCKPCIST